MSKTVPILALAAAMLVASGCVHPHHHAHAPVKKVAILGAEHGGPKVVVVHRKPAPARSCWRHRRHRHCHR